MAMASADDTFTQCQYCGKQSSPTQRIRACTRCFSVGYCSKDCQRADWKKGKDGHKSRCCPTSPAAPTAATVGGVDPSPSSPHTEEDVVSRLEVKRGNGVWEDAGPINLLQDNMASATINSSNNDDNIIMTGKPSLPPVLNDGSTKQSLTKELPKRTQKLLGPESSSSNKYKYRHSPDGVDENLLIFFHGSGGSHMPFDNLGKKMQLPQTATLSLSASLSIRNASSHLHSAGTSTISTSSSFGELPFGLGYTWFQDMDYSTGESLSKDHHRRMKSLKHALEVLDRLLCSLMGMHHREDEEDVLHHDSTSWIPERIFLFGFSAGGCLAMETCRMWINAGRMPLGGAICIAGGIQTKEGEPLPGMKGKKGAQGADGSKRLNQPTDVLIITGSEDTTYPKEAAQSSKQFYHRPSNVQIHVQEGKGHSMIESKDEMQVIMEFLSKRLVRRMVSMEGQSCIR